MTEFFLRPDLRDALAPGNRFDDVLALQGQVFRELDGRRTLRFVRAGKSYFAKLHFGIGWLEIFKNLLSGRLPITSARNEWLAIRHLEQHDIGTMTLAGYGERGRNPARIESFVLTDELTDTISLEDLALEWLTTPPTPHFRRAIIHELARIARTMHQSGMNHRDFYLCHFLLANSQRHAHRLRLHLIDLHRAQIRAQTPYRWQLKDLAGLYFSAMDAGFSRRNLLRFVRLYSGKPLRQLDASEQRLWRQVEGMAIPLYQKLHGRAPSTLFYR
ncbi:lipopolysaccharide core heptose(I) kinase RfaP [Permianibacter sp. IMCC34836]|uniref:lipopolysaccharide core heptose(I) kinase RfaP n=1 Tax=Permianibacter fluminis TaxID=2738515 RepID=UPI0015558ED6|nr:lipopolysaccharide core heptose(I) kinase RfaP [Permianibacter fluminis]NQD35436.1 lipopolysaccharide core heptose(I) kinase RfaP [Permianibacter fluminis]